MFSYINCECLCYSKLCSGKHDDGGTCESMLGSIVSKPSRRHRVLRPLPSGHGDSSLCAVGLRYSRFPRCLCHLFLALCGALHPQPLVASSRQVQNIQQPSGSSQNKSNGFNKVGDTPQTQIGFCGGGGGQMHRVFKPHKARSVVADALKA